MYIVVVEDERGALISEHALYDGELRLGRGPDNDIVLPGTTVSRDHARVFLDGLTAYIVDEASANGVLVNDHRVRGPTPVDESHSIRLGEYRLYLERATGKLKPAQDGIGTAIVLPEHAHGKLVIIGGPQAGREHLLFEPITCIGRTDENDVSLADVSVSRHHARLKRQDDGSYVLTDLNSSNGSYASGRTVEQSMRVWHGQRLQFGNVECMLVDAQGKGRRRVGLTPNTMFALAVVGAAVLGVLLTLLLMR
ncbi:MAG: FHA domain-containing protein [Myxococcales bacterium]|nr:FHA domain-containing protein [Myxococcales bacterium]MCB9523346.1 FHA domain-containing protein [Myxococcales bacterium]